jgi:hypothetical protein
VNRDDNDASFILVARTQQASAQHAVSHGGCLLGSRVSYKFIPLTFAFRSGETVRFGKTSSGEVIRSSATLKASPSEVEVVLVRV